MTGAKKVRLCYRETKSTDGGARGGLMAHQKKTSDFNTGNSCLSPVSSRQGFLFFIFLKHDHDRCQIVTIC